MEKFLLFNTDGYNWHGLVKGKKYKIIKEFESGISILNDEGAVKKVSNSQLFDGRITLITKKGNTGLFL